MESVKKLHCRLIVAGLYRYPIHISTVLRSYALSQTHMSDAFQVFDQIPEPDNTLIWNTMIRGLARCDSPSDAICFYDRMRGKGIPPDYMTFPSVLKACARIPARRRCGRRVHSLCLKLGFASDLFVSNALIHLYASNGNLSCAKSVFDEMPLRDVVSWNSLLCGYSQNNCLREALGLFRVMQEEGLKADKVTAAKVLSACTRLGEWDLAESLIKYVYENNVELGVYLGNTLIDYYGRRGLVDSAQDVFNKMKEKNIVTSNAMITAYAKAGDLVSAREIFENMPERDLISWGSIITAYSQANQFSDALTLFRMMQKSKVKPDEVVIVSVLSACAHLGALDVGKWLHKYIKENEIVSDVYVGNALIDMYAKCGQITDAFVVFREMKEKDTLTWNAIILGLATNSYVTAALEAFSEMLQKGFKPNSVTFLGILIACAHGGLVDEGFAYFESMQKNYRVEPQMKHYGCMVKLLSQYGELEKAYKLIKEMPLCPDPVIWRTLLGACQVHGNVKLAEIAVKELNESDSFNSVNSLVLSNTYAGTDQWNEAMEIRVKMSGTDVQKIPGCSLIQINKPERALKASDHPVPMDNRGSAPY